jgi:hypothetical protein
MDETANLSLPYIMPQQAQKFVTHNEALRDLDSLVQLSVLDRDLVAPPPSPTAGDRYLVAAGASGGWAGQSGRIAAFQDGGWLFYVPQKGWCLWVADETLLVAFTGSAWVPVGGQSINPAPMVGVLATADATNRLSVKSNAVLFANDDITPGTGDIRAILSKAAAAKTASFVFQDNFSGRAEFGLTGDDNFHLKVSQDGSTWRAAIDVDAATGKVSFPANAGRELLTANRTYFVRTDGSDANGGLANTAGGAFLTLQRALDIAAGLDLNGFDVTISVGTGTFAAGVSVTSPWVGKGTVTLSGTAGSTTINSTGNCVTAIGAGVQLSVANLRLQSSGAAGIEADAGATITLGPGMVFGACATQHIRTNGQLACVIAQAASYTIADSASSHWYASPQGYINASGVAITLTGTPAFTTFAVADRLSLINAASATFSGTATGARYSSSANSVVNTASGGPSFLPGSTGGSSATGGQYL